MKEYYDRRAPEYDEWYLGTGLFAQRDRPAWEEELEQLVATLAALPPGRTLDVACGTGFLTRHLRGDVIGLDQSRPDARGGGPAGARRDVRERRRICPPLPRTTFFSPVITGHFYGHFEAPDRPRFLAEARRVDHELVVVDASREHSGVDDKMSSRVLNDGSTWRVYKRYFNGAALAEELGGGEVLHEGRWFVVVRSPA